MATKRKAAKSNGIVDFLAEVQRRRFAIQIALCADAEPLAEHPSCREPATFEARELQARVKAISKLGDMLDANTLDPFTRAARTAAGNDAETRLAVKMVRKTFGTCCYIARRAVPESTNDGWQIARNELNEAIHDLRACPAAGGTNTNKGGAPRKNAKLVAFAIPLKKKGTTLKQIAAKFNATQKPEKLATEDSVRKALGRAAEADD